MSAGDIFDDHRGLAADLLLLENLRWVKKQFFDRICQESRSRDPDVLATLRLESTYQLAEFLYLLRARCIETEEQIRMLAELHNEYIVDLTKDQAKVARMGLARDRLLDAIFTTDTMPRLVYHWAERPGTLDQSNLARFLAAVMSTETCRKVVIACSEAGFLVRERSPHGTILVRSLGALERLFGQSVRDLRQQIEKGS
jgi:hypothetical protein